MLKPAKVVDKNCKPEGESVWRLCQLPDRLLMEFFNGLSIAKKSGLDYTLAIARC